MILIKDGGIQNLTMKNISTEIGISEQGIYRHFKNKHAILCAIINSFNEHFETVLNDVKDIEKVTEKLLGIISSHIKYFNENPATAAVIFSEEIFKNDTKLSQKVKDVVMRRVTELTKLIKMGQESGVLIDTVDAQDMAYILLGSLRFLITTWRLSDFEYSLEKRGEGIKRSLAVMIKK